jgi:hypothetical protein
MFIASYLGLQGREISENNEKAPKDQFNASQTTSTSSSQIN